MTITTVLDAATLPGIPGVEPTGCDRCGTHQTFVRATFPDNRSLEFCNHHGQKYKPALIAAGATITDWSDQINEKPSSSANA
jgi:hypothetical protein